MTNEISEAYGIFECNHCHKFFTTDYSLQRHITKRHDQTTRSEKIVVPCYSNETIAFKNADEETLTCEVCGLICFGEASFYKHMFLHSNRPPEDGHMDIESPVTSRTQPVDTNKSSVNTKPSVTQHHVVNELPVNYGTQPGIGTQYHGVDMSPLNATIPVDSFNQPQVNYRSENITSVNQNIYVNISQTEYVPSNRERTCYTSQMRNGDTCIDKSIVNYNNVLGNSNPLPINRPQNEITQHKGSLNCNMCHAKFSSFTRFSQHFVFNKDILTCKNYIESTDSSSADSSQVQSDEHRNSSHETSDTVFVSLTEIGASFTTVANSSSWSSLENKHGSLDIQDGFHVNSGNTQSDLINVCGNIESEHYLLQQMYTDSSLIQTGIDKQTDKVSEFHQTIDHHKQPHIVYDLKHARPTDCTNDPTDDLCANDDGHPNHSSRDPNENSNDHPTTENHFTDNDSDELNQTDENGIAVGHASDDLNDDNGIAVGHASDDLNDDNGIEIGHGTDDRNDDNGIEMGHASDDRNDNNGIEIGHASDDRNDDNDIEIDHASDDRNDNNDIAIGHASDDRNDDNGIEIDHFSDDLNDDNGIEIDHASDDCIGDVINHNTYTSYQPNINNNHTTDESDHAADSNENDHKDTRISKLPVKVITEYVNSPNLTGDGYINDPVHNGNVKCNSTNNRKKKDRFNINKLKPYDNTKISSMDVKIQHDDDKETPKIGVSQKSDEKGQYRNKTQHKCHVCDKVFKEIQHLRSHITIHTGKKCTKCEICGKYLNACSMSTHLKRHRGILEKNYKCHVCGKSFVTDHYFKIHKRIHTGEKPFECSVCKQGFIRKDSLKMHICMSQKKENRKKVSELSEATSRCDICRVTFSSSISFNAHYRTTHLSEQLTKEYNDKKPFKCDLCDKKFTSKGNLKSHLLTHLGREAYPYKCDVCFMKFSHLSNVKSHMRTHTNVRPFKCEVCEVSFRRGSHLRHHMRIHNGDFSKCPKCAKTFSQPRYLNDHLIQVHGLISNKDSKVVKLTASIKRKQSFKCEICGKELSRRTRLYDHMRLHTGDKAFKCNNCDEGFISTYYLNKHYKQYPEHKINLNAEITV